MNDRFQLLPLTPINAISSQQRADAQGLITASSTGPPNNCFLSPFGAPQSSRVIRTAERQRDQATAALVRVVGLIASEENARAGPSSRSSATPLPATNTTVSGATPKYIRVSPGHFVVPHARDASRKANDLLASLTNLTPMMTSKETNKLQGPLDLLTLTPISAPVPGGSISNTNSSPPSQWGLRTTVERSRLGPIVPTASVGSLRRMVELQQRHVQLLEDCEAAEAAARAAVETRTQANQDVQTAEERLANIADAVVRKEAALKDIQTSLESLLAHQKEIAADICRLQEEAAAHKTFQDAARESCSQAKTELESIQIEVANAQDMLDRVKRLEVEGQLAVDNTTQRLRAVELRRGETEAEVVAAEDRLLAVNAKLEAALEALKCREALVAEAEALLEEKEGKAAAAQVEWEAAETHLGKIEIESIEIAGKLETRRGLLAEEENRYDALQGEIRRLNETIESVTLELDTKRAVLDQVLEAIEEAFATQEEADHGVKEAQERAQKMATKADEEEARVVEAQHLLANTEGRAMQADMHAVQAEKRFNESRQRAEETEGRAKEIEEREHQARALVAATEQRLACLLAEVAEADDVVTLKAQLETSLGDQDALRAELAASREREAQAHSISQEVEAELQEKIFHLQDLIKTLDADATAAKGALETEREARAQAERTLQERCAAFEQLRDTMTHDIEHLQRGVRELEAELGRNMHDSTSSNARIKALESARDAMVHDVATATAEAARWSAIVEELKANAHEYGKLISTLRKERMEARALADALQLQVETLKDRLRREAVTPSAARGNADEGLRNRLELESRCMRLEMQNKTLKAMTLRLSQSLAEAVRPGASGASDLIPAIHGLEKQPIEIAGWMSNGDTIHRQDQLLSELAAIQKLISAPSLILS